MKTYILLVFIIAVNGYCSFTDVEPFKDPLLNNTFCSIYANKTCCTHEEAIFGPYNKTWQDHCFLSYECFLNLVHLSCSYICSPDLNKYLKGWVVQICKLFADDIYDACETSTFVYHNDTCHPIGNIYHNSIQFIDDWFSNYKVTYSEPCLMYGN